MEFKERLKEALTIRNMKAIDLAGRCGISRGQVSHYLSGRGEPKAKRLHTIATVLNVSESWLMGLDVPMDRTPEATLMNDVIIQRFNTLSRSDQLYVIDLIHRLSDKREL